MITRLQGRLLEKHPTEVVLDVQGVGYRVFVPLSVFVDLPDTGQAVILHTHFVVREDAQHLYGFLDRDERRLFQELIRVSGIGPKLGMAILSGMDAEGLVRCIRESDLAALVRLPGVGRKTAERLVVEMRDRLGDWVAAGSSLQPVAAAVPNARQEAETALQALGYKPAQAAQVVQAVLKEAPDSSTETIIRQCLRRLGSK